MSWNDSVQSGPIDPAALTAWVTLRAEATRAVSPDLSAAIQERIGALFGGAAAEATPPLTESAVACTETIDQFLIDVSAMTDAQRETVGATLGHGTYPFFQALYVFDLDFRFRNALEQLFDNQELLDISRTEPDFGAERPDLWPLLDEFLTLVATLENLDPVTTELVRLRGARAHNCRICQSRRNVTAVEDGADEAVFDQIDYFETSELSERHKVALRLTDAIIWQPAAYPDGLAAQVRAHFTAEEALEIVLDVVRNAANKVAVALQADQPVVNSGVEYFRIDPDGTLAYGLPAPAHSGS